MSHVGQKSRFTPKSDCARFVNKRQKEVNVSESLMNDARESLAASDIKVRGKVRSLGTDRDRVLVGKRQKTLAKAALISVGQ